MAEQLKQIYTFLKGPDERSNRSLTERGDSISVAPNKTDETDEKKRLVRSSRSLLSFALLPRSSPGVALSLSHWRALMTGDASACSLFITHLGTMFKVRPRFTSATATATAATGERGRSVPCRVRTCHRAAIITRRISLGDAPSRHLIIILAQPGQHERAPEENITPTRDRVSLRDEKFRQVDARTGARTGARGALTLWGVAGKHSQQRGAARIIFSILPTRTRGKRKKAVQKKTVKETKRNGGQR